MQARKLTQANLVHDSDTSLLALLVEFLHSRRDIRGGDNILLSANSRLDNSGVESVGDQRDDQVGLLHSLVQGSIIADIEGDGLGVLEARGKRLGTLKGTASCLSSNDQQDYFILSKAHRREWRMVLVVDLAEKMLGGTWRGTP